MQSKAFQQTSKRRFKVPEAPTPVYTVVCRSANAVDAHKVSGHFGHVDLTWDAAVRLLWRVEGQYVADGYEVRYSTAGDGFVVEYRGRFHASYAIVEVE